MTQVNRANAAVNLNLPGAWNGGSGPAPTSVDIAAWGTPNITTGPSQALGGAVSWQGILLQLAQTTNISIGTTAAAMTLGASGVDLSASGANLAISAPVAITLGANQQWTVASGRTLTVSGVITGDAKDVTFAGAGTTVLNTANNSTSWTNSKLTVASGAFVQANANRILGATTNTVEVQSGGALYIASLQTSAFTVNNFTVAGSGVSGKQAGAIFIATSGDFSAGKTITLTGASPVIGVQAGAQAGIVAGNATTGVVTFNMFGTNTASATFSNFSTFTVATGSRLVLQGVNPTTGATVVADFGLATTDDNGLGNANNKVSVKSSLRLITNATTTLYRDYFFEGKVGSAAPTGTTTYSIATPENALFQGTITATALNWVAVNNAAQSAQRTLQFGSALGGKLDGTWNLRSFALVQTIYLHPGLDISTWTGDLWAYRVSYGVAPTGAATYDTTAVIDNISGSTLTLAHSGYTLLGDLTFTGTSSMNLGLGNVATSTTPALTVSANTLTIPGNISGPTALLKNGAGTLILSGSNTMAVNVTLSAGTLVLNSAGSAGGTATQFIFTAGAGAELDSTTGVSLNQTGAINTGTGAGSWTWKGTNSLTFGPNNVTAGGDRIITFGTGGGLGTLKFSGAITTATLTTSWDFGGSTAGAKQRVTLVGANASLSETTAANQHAVTAGYFCIENNNGLGAVSATTTWWVGATNLGAQTTKAALELANVTTPEIKSVNLYNIGPKDDGALIGASGISVFSGNISVPNVAGTRIGVKAGATLTLLGSGIYPNLNPANASTPLSFTAESGGTLNVNRSLGGPTQGGSNVGTVTVANGTGTVVFSRANLHTGAMTCSSGTTKLTHTNAAGATSGNSVAVTAGATMEVTVKAVFPATLTLGFPGSAATFKVSV